MQAAVDGGKPTSLALAVVHRGKVIWEEAFGFEDREQRKTATIHTPYCLASITKTFTATLVASLSERHRFSLDDSSEPFLKSTPLQGPNGNPSDVTIRMLGAHCSGLPEMFTAELPEGGLGGDVLHEYGRLAYPPGLIYEYSNLGYQALGAIAEHLTGQTFGVALRKAVLSPLRMNDSFFSHERQRVMAAAVGYDEHGERIPRYRTSTPASGELYSSAHDLARYLLPQVGKRSIRPVLDIQGMNCLREPVFRGPSGVSTTFGWFTANLTSGEPYYFKAGGQPGVAAKVFVLPSLELGFVVLTNQSGAMPVVDQCCQSIIRNFVPDFRLPAEDAGSELAELEMRADWLGEWRGQLLNGGADQKVRLTFDRNAHATLSLSDHAEFLKDLHLQAGALVAASHGLIACTDSASFGMRPLAVKLTLNKGQLIGRVIATGTRPRFITANIPYVVDLVRA